MPDPGPLKFSIITCTKNSALHLEQTIASVRSQTYEHLEHIFVDADSEDGTRRIIEAQQTERMRVYTRPGKGIANAMNEGVRLASGDVILHLHSDDYLAHPQVLSRVAGYFASGACQWLFGRTLLDNKGGWTPEAPQFPAYSYPRLIQGNIIPHPATFLRKSLFDRVGLFDETLKFAMDYDMWLRLGKVTPPIQYPEFFSVFRCHPGSATFSNRMASFMEDHQVRRKHSNPWSVGFVLNELRHLRRKSQLQRVLRAPLT